MSECRARKKFNRADGCDAKTYTWQMQVPATPKMAMEKVARLERKRLERIAADCVAPMEAEPSIEGRPPGEQERQPRGQVARPKRARGSGRPETG